MAERRGTLGEWTAESGRSCPTAQAGTTSRTPSSRSPPFQSTQSGTTGRAFAAAAAVTVASVSAPWTSSTRRAGGEGRMTSLCPSMTMGETRRAIGNFDDCSLFITSKGFFCSSFRESRRRRLGLSCVSSQNILLFSTTSSYPTGEYEESPKG